MGESRRLSRAETIFETAVRLNLRSALPDAACVRVASGLGPQPATGLAARRAVAGAAWVCLCGIVRRSE